MSNLGLKLRRGDPAPYWTAATDANARFVFSSLAGRYVLLGFLGSVSQPGTAEALSALPDAAEALNGDHACALLVSIDPTDRDQARIPQSIPFWRAVSVRQQRLRGGGARRGRHAIRPLLGAAGPAAAGAGNSADQRTARSS
jgi:hypothetical protein